MGTLKTTSVEMLFFGGGHLELHRYLVELCNSFGHNSVPQCPGADTHTLLQGRQGAGTMQTQRPRAPGFPSARQPKAPFRITEAISFSLPSENPQLLFNKAVGILKCVFQSLGDLEQNLDILQKPKLPFSPSSGQRIMHRVSVHVDKVGWIYMCPDKIKIIL